MGIKYPNRARTPRLGVSGRMTEMRILSHCVRWLPAVLIIGGLVALNYVMAYEIVVTTP